MIRWLPHPWSFVDEISAIDGAVSLNGSGSARVVISDEAHQQPRWNGRLLPRCGFPFLHQSRRLQAYSLPYVKPSHDSTGEGRFVCGSEDITVLQEGLLVRPLDGQGTPAAFARDQWLRWQIDRYQKLAFYNNEGSPTPPEASLLQGGTRRSWSTVREEWLNVSKDDVRISLIVRLADNLQLRAALDSVSAGPRQVLERYRANTSISRIQELDAHCIRHFAQLPGRNTLEKAGAKQQLLSVRRRQAVDTLENRVARWVLQQLFMMASLWLQEHQAATGGVRGQSETVSRVLTLRRMVSDWNMRPVFSQITDLTDLPNQPNYPLQFELRYRQIWETYLAIRRDMRIFDEAWMWQRRVWAESGRQILHSLMTEKWNEWAESTPYYRTEPLEGRWVNHGVAPGPFVLNGNHIAYLFDANQVQAKWPAEEWASRVHELFPGASAIGVTGCEQCLWFPNRRMGLLVWYSSRDPAMQSLANLCGQVATSLQQLNATCRTDSVRFYGLIFVSDIPNQIDGNGAEVDAYQPRADGSNIVCVSVPLDAMQIKKDLNVWMDIALEELVEEQ